jgi:hypothetical protein
MGSSDPLPAGFEIQFGSLNFQATGNGYLMRITNPASIAPATHTSVSAPVDAAGPSSPRRRRRSV